MTTRKQNTESIVDGMNALRRKMMANYLKHSKIGAMDITPSQLAVITIIMEKEKVGVKELALTLGITSSAATQLVEALVTKGYVLKKSDVKDRRALFLQIPPKVKQKMLATKNKMTEQLAHMFDTLSDAELAQFAKLNKKIVNQLLNK